MLGPKAINRLEIRLELDIVLGIQSSCSSVQTLQVAALQQCPNASLHLSGKNTLSKGVVFFASFWL